MTDETVAPSDLFGAAIQRSEDPHLITGDAEYTDDIAVDDELHLAVLRSQFGHADVSTVDVSGAAAVDGVVKTITWADIEASDAPGYLPVDDPAGEAAESDTDTGATVPEYPMLADGRVAYQGQPIAAVVAEDRYTAHDAVGRIDVTYEPREAVTDPTEALSEGAPELHDVSPGNVAFEWDTGDEAAADSAIAAADEVIGFEFEINRVMPTAIEPRAALAQYRPSEGVFVQLSTQNPHQVRDDLAATLGIDPDRIRVRPPDVGGGFGAKLYPYTGQLLTAWCARELGRPVKWVATRSEDCESMIHARHHLVDARVGVDADGTIRGFRAETTAPVGAYLVPGGSGVPTNLGVMANGQYDVPGAYVHTRGVFTNTAPLAAYRGAGRPEATYFIERLVKTVARELDVDPVAVRRRNFVPPAAFPFETGLGRTYDSGAYDEALTTALDIVDYEGFRERQRRARTEGRYLGIGLSCYVEACGSGPGRSELGCVAVDPSGTVTVRVGTAEIGTGHRTGYAQIAASQLEIPMEDVEVIEGDTGEVAEGKGTSGSRAMAVGGSAVQRSAVEVLDRARTVAGHHLEAAGADLEFADGEFSVRGAPDRSVTLSEVAEIATNDPPPGMDPGLDATTQYDPPNYTFPFGAHVAVVAVDPDAGDVEIERYVAVDDVGTQINPKIVEGQIHGGVAQGIGQALKEEAVYDDNGTLLTGSLQDYAMPRAEDIPEIEWESTVTPCPHNPLGVKGVGEAGAIAAPPAVVNAVVDALAPLDVDGLDMPLTPERIWRAIDSA
jgi:carbon-monoxide dehydrogenase large subunit